MKLKRFLFFAVLGLLAWSGCTQNRSAKKKQKVTREQ